MKNYFDALAAHPGSNNNSPDQLYPENPGSGHCPAKYADKEGIYPKVNYVNADHVNALIDLPTAFSIEKAVQLLKGSSSHWTNSNHIIAGKFAWGRGYGAFSISHSNVDVVMRYIADQEEHHRQRTFTEELREFIDRHGLRWRDEEGRLKRLTTCSGR